jgi:hypothetical protein
MIRRLNYDLTATGRGTHVQFEEHGGKALTLDISSGGMLLLMEHQPKVTQVVKLYITTIATETLTPTWGEVAWVRPAPMAPDEIHFVGVKFVIGSPLGLADA